MTLFDWEQRKLGENLKNIYTGTNLLGKVSNTGIPLIKMGNIQRGYFSFEKLEFLEEDASVPDTNIIQYGDFLFNTRNTLELVGKGATWMFKNKKYTYNNNIAVFHFKDIDTVYFNYFYNTDKMIDKIHSLATGTTSVAAIYPQALKNLSYYLPPINEQKTIGYLFKKLDKLITLQQRKLKLFDQLRKTLLEYLISEHKIPIVRFNSFRKEWKVFRLQNLIIKTTKGKAKADMVGNRSIYLDIAYLNGGALSTVDAPTDVYKDDIIILWDGSLAGKVYHGFSGALGSTLKSFTPKYSGEYLFQYLQRSQEKIFKNYRTPNIPHVVKDFITIFKVNAPSLEEQNKISTILELIDLLIDNQNTKIKECKKIKEHLLQKMFI